MFARRRVGNALMHCRHEKEERKWKRHGPGDGDAQNISMIQYADRRMSTSAIQENTVKPVNITVGIVKLHRLTNFGWRECALSIDNKLH